MRRVYQQDEKGRRYYQLDEELKGLPMGFPPGPIHCTTTVPIDITDADSFRKDAEKEAGIHITLTSLIIKAAANALEDFPILCGMWQTIDRIWCPNPGEMNAHCPVQIGDRIGFCFIDKASQKSLLQISKEFNSQVEEIRSANKVGWPEEWQPKPSLCITNVGTIGPIESGSGAASLYFISTLDIFAILEKPVVKGGKIVIRKIINGLLDFDHRAMMGNTPIEFLNELKRNLEDPDTYLI